MRKKMADLKPKLDELNKKYANNQEKLAQEQVKLYKNVGYNPLGCFTSFVPQILILSVLSRVIRAITSGNLDGIYPFVKNIFYNGEDVVINSKFIIWDLTKSYTNVGQSEGYFSRVAIYYLILAILVGVVQFFMNKLVNVLQNPDNYMKKKEIEKTKKKSKNNEEFSPEEMQAKMTESTMMILPLSTSFMAASTYSVLSIYWIAQSFALLLQYFILDWDKSKKGVQNFTTIMKEKNKKEENL